LDWFLFAVQWLHVVLAILWFGGVLYADVVLVPAFATLPVNIQRSAVGAIGVRANRIIPPAAGLVILLGILRGTVFGQVRSLEALTSTYGLTWLLSFVLAAGTFIYGMRVVGPTLERIGAISEADAVNPDGSPTPAALVLIGQAKRNGVIELLLFLAIFTCMILMRFGL
jgi:uncharacterized membrane protein